MQIFGVEPVAAALIIAAVGILYSVGLGYAKNVGAFDYRKLILSILIAGPGSIIFVATGILNSNAPDDLTTLILVIGWILTIGGTDSAVKGIATLVKNKKA